MYCLFVLFYVLFLCVALCIVCLCCSMYCLCVNVYYCHRVTTQFQLNTGTSYRVGMLTVDILCVVVIDGHSVLTV